MIWLFIYMELEACMDEYVWLIICYLCAINDCADEYCPPIHLPVSPKYTKNLGKRMKMTRNGRLCPLKMILNTRYPLPVQQ